MPSPLDNVTGPIAQRLLAEASAVRDRTLRVQEATLGVLNLPTAEEVQRLERRLRSATEDIARLEDLVDRLEARVRTLEA